MPLIQVVVALIVVGVLLWLVNLIPMQGTRRKILLCGRLPIPRREDRSYGRRGRRVFCRRSAHPTRRARILRSHCAPSKNALRCAAPGTGDGADRKVGTRP